jgi:hypothetical protein
VPQSGQIVTGPDPLAGRESATIIQMITRNVIIMKNMKAHGNGAIFTSNPSRHVQYSN